MRGPTRESTGASNMAGSSSRRRAIDVDKSARKACGGDERNAQSRDAAEEFIDEGILDLRNVTGSSRVALEKLGG